MVSNHYSVIYIRHGSSEFKLENLTSTHNIGFLKKQIEELTMVKPNRQKIFGLKHKDGVPMNDEMTLEEFNFVTGMKIMMMGSQEKDIKQIESANKARLPPLDDDFDIQEDEDDSDLRLHLDPDNQAKIQRRIESYQIKVINPPRPGKKLLVLDIDHTIIDSRSLVQQASDYARPYLHEFLTEAYKNYDICFWSATSMRYIVAKLEELRISSNENYKIAFYLDGGAMISVKSQKYKDIVNLKPLQVIYAKFPEYNSSNSIIIDDTRRNFLMNTQNGLKIKAYKNCIETRDTDDELLHLSIYLTKIAQLESLEDLNHKNWMKYIERKRK